MSVQNRSLALSRRRGTARLLSERGAAAVEFALVVPVLVFLLLGIIEFSKAYNVQATLSAGAREGARAMALGNAPGDAAAAVVKVAEAAHVPVSAGQVSVVPKTCTGAAPNTTVTVTVTHHQAFGSGFLGGVGVDLTGKAVMRCGG